MKKYFNYLHITLMLFGLFTYSQMVLAKAINLYEQPKTDSKVVGTIDSTVGVITIFKPKEGDFVKVADPRNGDVGWVKSADLGNVNVNYNVIKTSDGTHQYQFIQYGSTKPYSTEEISKAMKQMELRQQIVQKDMQKMMQDMYAEWFNFPLQPIFIVPVKETAANKNASQPAVAKNNSQK